MNRPVLLSLLALPATVGLLLATPAVASAESAPTGADFGRHVSHCAQTMGFDAEHNPGMHQGFSGWDGMPC